MRQLVARGHVYSDAARYGALKLTPQARPLLRGDENLTLREAPRREPRATAAKKRAAAFAAGSADEQLWEALRECRLRLATEANVPPYVVFHDATLKEFVRARPNSLDAMLALHGVGQASLTATARRSWPSWVALTGDGKVEGAVNGLAARWRGSSGDRRRSAAGSSR